MGMDARTVGWFGGRGAPRMLVPVEGFEVEREAAARASGGSMCGTRGVSIERWRVLGRSSRFGVEAADR
jgi:hypothetical protein